MEILSHSLILAYLKTLAGEALTEPEQAEWDVWHATHPGQQLGAVLAHELAVYEEVVIHKADRTARLRQQFATEFGEWPQPRLVGRPGMLRPLLRIAAVVLLVIGAAALAYHFFGGRTTTPPAVEQIMARISDRLPDKDIAVVLADGRILVVDREREGLVAQLADQRIDLQGNELVFHATAAAQPTTRVQAVHTPPGQPIRVRLSDSSQVYLNAVSQLQFPTVFPPQERLVRYDGQAYFDVAKQYSDIAKKKEVPFFAVNGQDSVEVTGTRFSVRAYAGEAYKDVALLSGEVIVRHASLALRPRPLEVLRLYPNGGYAVQPKDVYELVAFKDDHFYYDSSRLSTILGDLSRWYGVPLAQNERLQAQGYYRLDTISRQTPLPTILGLLESTRRVQFGKDKNKIEVIR